MSDARCGSEDRHVHTKCLCRSRAVVGLWVGLREGMQGPGAGPGPLDYCGGGLKPLVSFVQYSTRRLYLSSKRST